VVTFVAGRRFRPSRRASPRACRSEVTSAKPDVLFFGGMDAVVAPTQRAFLQ
jgi:hypothetical protein